MKNGFYMTIGDNQLSGWTEKMLQSTFQSQTWTKIRSCRCLVVCCPFDPLKLSKSWRNHYIWEVCSANWWDARKTSMPAASNGQQKGPNSSPQQRQTIRHMTNTAKFNELGYKFLPPPPYSPDLLPTNYHFFKHLDNFLQGKYFQDVENTAGCRKCFPRVYWIPRHRFLCYKK